MAATQPSLKLNSGYDMPQVGLGTWQSKPGEVTASVITAIEAGYRHIDGARIYQNEPEVGAAVKAKIADGTVKREDLFITSKLWNNAHRPDCVLPAIKRTLADLELEYVDLYLVHWPMGLQPGETLIPLDADGKPILDNETDLADTWKAMEELVKLGLAKSIGVSNFNKRQIENILKIATIPPANNQIEMHPYFTQRKLVDYCHSKGITVTAYSPFGCPTHPMFPGAKCLEEPKILEVGKKYGQGANHVIIRWLIQRGVIAIPKSVTKSRIIDNFNVFDFTLTEDDIKDVESLDKGPKGRINSEPHMLGSKDYGFNDEY
jgi:aldehyde reductase